MKKCSTPPIGNCKVKLKFFYPSYWQKWRSFASMYWQGCREIRLFIHWINQYSPFGFKVKTFWFSNFHFVENHMGILEVICFQYVFVSSNRTSRLTGHLSSPALQFIKGSIFVTFFLKPIPNSSYFFTVLAGIYSPSSAKSSLNLCLNISFTFLLLWKPKFFVCAVWLLCFP